MFKKFITKIAELSIFSFFLILFLIHMSFNYRNVHAYSVSGEIDGLAAGGAGVDYLYAVSDGPTSLNNQLSDTGPVGNHANGWFEANLTSGFMKTYAGTHGVYVWDNYPFGGVPHGAQMFVKSTMGDTLYFDISAGTYNEDIFVTLNGTVSGYILHESYPYGSAYQEVSVTFVGIGFNSYGVIRYSSFSESFSVSTKIVQAGEIFAGPMTRRAEVGVISEGFARAVVTDLIPEADNIADFGNSIHITSVEIPEEVTAWHSGSGVFLSAVPTCFWDIEPIPYGDGDVDGMDLREFRLGLGPEGYSQSDLESFGTEFGRTDCLD